jgi:hypothetical protein
MTETRGPVNFAGDDLALMAVGRIHFKLLVFYPSHNRTDATGCSPAKFGQTFEEVWASA